MALPSLSTTCLYDNFCDFCLCKFKRLVLAVQPSGTEQAAYDLQFQLEKALHHERSLSGASLDLVKAFNTLDRGANSGSRIPSSGNAKQCDPPLASLTCPHGASLLSRITVSTTGLPEGDPFSACGMLGIAMTYCEVAKAQGASPLAFADDFSCSGSHRTLPSRGFGPSKKATKTFGQRFAWTNLALRPPSHCFAARKNSALCKNTTVPPASISRGAA